MEIHVSLVLLIIVSHVNKIIFVINVCLSFHLLEMELASLAMFLTALSVPMLMFAQLVMEITLQILKDNVSFVNLHAPPAMLMDLVQLVPNLSTQFHQKVSVFLVRIHSA